MVVTTRSSLEASLSGVIVLSHAMASWNFSVVVRPWLWSRLAWLARSSHLQSPTQPFRVCVVIERDQEGKGDRIKIRVGLDTRQTLCVVLGSSEVTKSKGGTPVGIRSTEAT